MDIVNTVVSTLGGLLKPKAKPRRRRKGVRTSKRRTSTARRRTTRTRSRRRTRSYSRR
ncbi:hypothetical protein ACFSKN_02075 [Mariniflexile gromovii]|uniref:Uncharacterized protein n=1 Tax=Mariniflexile gromovii TaxID=362523 RepID=A0ABS4BP62_9FLAO|nr:hypothetical protein [Mariniflexile gromovii]MBP0902389.1 hypothetical protein [Mariniflexile gromovii]